MALKIMGYDIKYVPCTAIKSQALADLVAEWMEVRRLQMSPTNTRPYTSMGRLWDTVWGTAVTVHVLVS
jgi:hypothetical protein